MGKPDTQDSIIIVKYLKEYKQQMIKLKGRISDKCFKLYPCYYSFKNILDSWMPYMWNLQWSDMQKII